MKMIGSPSILAFDTSGPHCAAALLTGKRIAASRCEQMTRGQAERLFPMLEAVLGETGAAWHDLDAIAVGTGPGNFTGIRIAVSAARGLALGLGIPAIGVSTFEVMSFGVMDDSVLVSLEAPRGQAYVQPFRRGAPNGEPRLIDPGNPPRDLQMSFGTSVIGFRAGDIGGTYEASFQDAALEDIPRRLCLIAEMKMRSGADSPRPAPLYVRPADAAPASDPPPVILP